MQMIPHINIWCSAALVIKNYGDTADIEGHMNNSATLEKGKRYGREEQGLSSDLVAEG
jgi:hypothetical protein